MSQPPPLEPQPRVVLFDLDDTLCDYAGARATRLRLAFAHGLGSNADHHFDLDRMVIESIAMHPHGADHFAELFVRHGCRDAESPGKAAEWYRRNRFHGLALFPETERTLRVVRQQREELPVRTIGIVTNGPAEVQRAKLTLLGVQNLVDFVIISGELGIAKPDPEIFREALRRAGARADEAVYVGDSVEFDMAGARGAGIRSVWVNPREDRWEGTDPRPDREIRSIGEFLRLLDSARDR